MHTKQIKQNNNNDNNARIFGNPIKLQQRNETFYLYF